MDVISTRGLVESASNEKFNCSLNLLMWAAAVEVVLLLTWLAVAATGAAAELAIPDPVPVDEDVEQVNGDDCDGFPVANACEFAIDVVAVAAAATGDDDNVVAVD